MLKTEQQKLYELAYRSAGDEYGFPDRKIGDNCELKGKQILVLGCGTGNDVWYLAKDAQIIGMDYATSGVDLSRRHDIQGVTGDLNLLPTLPFGDSRFDVVVCKDILEHLVDPLAVLCEVRRVLRDDGYVVISVPNQFYLFSRIRILLGQGILYRTLLVDHSRDYDEWNYMHIRFFTYKGFCRFLHIAGFTAKKWYWDFGTLAHYHQPEMWFEPQLWKKSQGEPLSSRAKVGLIVLRPLWRAYNIIFPRGLRALVVSLAPGLLCAGFYVHARKT